MKQLAFWVRNPDIRELAISLDGQGKPIKDVIAGIIKEYGEEAAPNPGQVTKLRMDLARGKYGQREKISPKGRNDMNAGAEACRHQNQSSGRDASCHQDEGQARRPAATKIKKPYTAHKTYWDYHPTITRFTARLVSEEDLNIQDAIARRFGEQYRPEIWQIQMFRDGLETGRFAIKDNRTSKEPLSEATLRLFSNEQATECLIPGIRLWKLIHCLKRQLRFRVGQDERTWNDLNPNRQSKRMLIPELAHCAKCVNWVSAGDLRILRRKIQKGFTVEAVKQ